MKEKRMEGFREILNECGLFGMGFFGSWFTWKRGNLAFTNIKERLERGVANGTWLFHFQNVLI